MNEKKAYPSYLNYETKNYRKKEERKKKKLTFFSREETAFLFEKTYYHFT